MTKLGKIGVLMGGISAEREVSLRSGTAVLGALKALGHYAVAIDAQADVCQSIAKEGISVAYLALHGGWGENGGIQGLLDVMGIPYTGSGVLASALAMDKIASKTVFKARGLPVPEFEIINSPEGAKSVSLPFPVVVKPQSEGSSVGVSIVRDKSALMPALEAALLYGGSAVVEEFIQGKEIQIAILGGRAIGGVEVRPKAEFYSYEAKYTSGMTEYIIPPELDEKTYIRVSEVAVAAHRSLGCRGATRVDLIVGTGGPYVLEVNTIPGMTETSLLPKIAGHAGLSFPALVMEMLMDALEGGRA